MTYRVMWSYCALYHRVGEELPFPMIYNTCILHLLYQIYWSSCFNNETPLVICHMNATTLFVTRYLKELITLSIFIIKCSTFQYILVKHCSFKIWKKTENRMFVLLAPFSHSMAILILYHKPGFLVSRLIYQIHNTRCPGATCRAHMSKHLYSLFDSVTLTFDIESRVLYWTHLHIIIVIILTKYHEYITIICKVIYHWQGKSHLWPLRVTLTFDIKSWILYATHLQIIVNIFTKYHEDTTTTY